jgi:hypothetical protein
MRSIVTLTAMTCWLTTAVTSVALARRGDGGLSGEPMARYFVEGGRGGVAAPEIDGPGGIAAIALLVSVGMIAYNRYKQR